MSFTSWVTKLENTFVGKLVTSFVRAFLGVFVVGVIGVGSDVANTHDWSAAKAALVALVSAAFVAGFRALQAAVAKV